MTDKAPEEVLEPGRRIIDAHHHLIDAPGHQYAIDDYAADCARGHDVRASVYIEVRRKYLEDGPEHLRPVGETAFVASVAEKAEQGAYEGRRLCAGIVGYADLAIGDRVAEVLDAHVEAAGGRFRGIRRGVYWDGDLAVYDHVSVRPPNGLMLDAEFQRGFAQLGSHALSFDAVLFHPQLPELAQLAGRFPETTIILNHLGFRLGVGGHALNCEETDRRWRQDLAALAERPNVMVKIGGLGMRIWGFDIPEGERPGSEVLAGHWRPYFENVLEIFGADRVILESNYPVDAQTTTFITLWNALKRLTETLSDDEKHRLYWANANRAYRLGLSL
ncbi:MAG: amidohydrolase family protein [Alphaproteobacteria bacterium]|nr:amidohydrolase family protein [Alphaproteobacteria bacterium]